MELEDLFTDTELEEAGTWVDAGDYDPSMAGLELKVARVMNAAFARMFDEEVRNAGPEFQDDSDRQMDIMLRCTAKTILRGWRNLTVKTKPVKFSDAKCLELLTKSTDLRNLVMRIARTRHLYKLKQSEDDLKN